MNEVPPINGLPTEGTPSAGGNGAAGSVRESPTPRAGTGEPHRARPMPMSSERYVALLEQLDLSRKEVHRARAKFPTNEHLLAALAEEVGELNHAFLEGEGKARIQAEARQVAAVALRIATEGTSEFGGFGEEPEGRASVVSESDLFEEEAAAPVMAAAREMKVVGTIGGAGAVAAPEKVEQRGYREPTLADHLYDVWPYIQKIRGQGFDMRREAGRSSSEIAKGLERIRLGASGRPLEALQIANRLAPLLVSAAGKQDGSALTGHVVRRALGSAMNQLVRDLDGSPKRYCLTVQSVGERLLWSWREVTG